MYCFILAHLNLSEIIVKYGVHHFHLIYPYRVMAEFSVLRMALGAEGFTDLKNAFASGTLKRGISG
jgi:hypothetical protein